ncbi:hypothetical protein AB1Y20_016546 [Prymnesium parvum]|uniref:Uncharacterized protein n=1 Tax=Prymnesium parvum TaxID=97485 RepID=A0AB34ICX9_PRYPA
MSRLRQALTERRPSKPYLRPQPWAVEVSAAIDLRFSEHQPYPQCRPLQDGPHLTRRCTSLRWRTSSN